MTDREEWLAWRRRRLGATDCAAIMGTHAFMGPWEVWLSKLHGADQPDSPELEMGRDLERPVLEWAARELGGTLSEGIPLEHPVDPIGGSPDGWVHVVDGSVGVEAKTTTWMWTEIPPGYVDQVQVYMMLSGTARWLIAVWGLGDRRRRIEVVDADPERQELIRSTCSAWWQRHIVEGHPPDVDASDACREGLTGIHGRHNGRLRDATDEELRLALDLEATEQAIGQLDQDRAHLRNQLRAAIGPDEGIRWSEGKVTFHRPSGRLTVKRYT